MKMKFLYLCVFIVLGFGACQSPPEFSKIPEITFNNIVKYHQTKTATITSGDSINITINFQDGDGDLGLDAKDTVPPYFVDHKKTAVYNNLNISMYTRKNNQWVKLVFNSKLDLNAQFPRFQSGNKKSPLKGTMDYNFIIPDFTPNNFPIKKNDTIKFDINILDRALNKSNTITTPSLVLTLKPI
jgi:hypothetical protein